MMSTAAPSSPNVSSLDAECVALVRLAAAIAAGDESAVRRRLADARERVRTSWVEEVILQSYLFAGFPRTLNAAREWRRISQVAAPPTDAGERFADAPQWAARGEATCAVVYGPFYGRLRHNIRELHPALDAWMIVEGYGKVLSRDGLELRLRELCIVAACAAAGQDRQLHSHMHGALHTGSSLADVEQVLEALHDDIPADNMRRFRLLLSRVGERHVR
jgi:4-carboxymuconolactone decarboxylase